MATPFTKIHSRAAAHAAFALACLFVTTNGAFAQAGFVKNKPGDLPDSSQFYMSRRQIQVVDDSPIVKFGTGGPSAQGGSGPMPTGGQMALPRAGFGTNINASAPSITTPLPKVNNGVPPKPTPAEENAMKAKALALSKAQAKAVAAAKPKAPPPPQGIKAYNSYKGYNPAASLPAAAGGAAGSSTSTSAQVKGSVLHWSRRRHAE